MPNTCLFLYATYISISGEFTQSLYSSSIILFPFYFQWECVIISALDALQNKPIVARQAQKWAHSFITARIPSRSNEIEKLTHNRFNQHAVNDILLLYIEPSENILFFSEVFFQFWSPHTQSYIRGLKANTKKRSGSVNSSFWIFNILFAIINWFSIVEVSPFTFDLTSIF